jgi:hypothetical protein
VRRTAPFPQVEEGIRDFGKSIRNALLQGATFDRGPHAPWQALKHRPADKRLEYADLPADGGLANTELRRRLRQAAKPSRCLEGN